jgi:hypothetical protein
VLTELLRWLKGKNENARPQRSPVPCCHLRYSRGWPTIASLGQLWVLTPLAYSFFPTFLTTHASQSDSCISPEAARSTMWRRFDPYCLSCAKAARRGALDARINPL